MCPIPLKTPGGEVKEYATVDERMVALNKDHGKKYNLVISHDFEDGRITATAKLTIFIEKSGGHTECVYIDSATEYGTQRKTQEKCSSHAIGRVLALAGYYGTEYNQEGMSIASANEMESFLNAEDRKADQVKNGSKDKVYTGHKPDMKSGGDPKTDAQVKYIMSLRSSYLTDFGEVDGKEALDKLEKSFFKSRDDNGKIIKSKENEALPSSTSDMTKQEASNYINGLLQEHASLMDSQ